MNSSDNLVLRIYDTVAEPMHWQSVLDEIVDETGAVAANLFQGDTVHGELQSAWMSSLISDCFEREKDIAIIDSEIDLYGAIPQLLPEKKFSSETLLLEMYQRSGFPPLNLNRLRSWLQNDYGIYHRLASPLNCQPHYFDFLTLHYGEKYQGVMPPAELLDRGNVLLPHVAKAVEVNRPFVLLYKRFQATLEVLDRLHLGVIIMGMKGQVWLSNASADRILDRGDSLAISRHGALITRRKRDQGVLSAAIENLTDAISDKVKSCRLRFSRLQDTEYYIADLSLLRNSVLGTRSDPRGVLMIIADPDRPQLVSLNHVGKLFGLTAAEMSVCDLVIKGFSNSEMAEIRNVSPETIITQLKSIFLKTGVHKRGELIHLAHSVNIPVDPPGDGAA